MLQNKMRFDRGLQRFLKRCYNGSRMWLRLWGSGAWFWLVHGQLEEDPVISGVSIVITHAKGLITPIKTTHESLNPKP